VLPLKVLVVVRLMAQLVSWVSYHIWQQVRKVQGVVERMELGCKGMGGVGGGGWLKCEQKVKG
jgi:hypothetical protein